MDPRSAYREGSARGASGTRLVVLLYEQAIQDLRKAVLAIEEGDIGKRTKSITHAISVIGHLQATVDRQRGGTVGGNLDRFYCSVRARLIEAQVGVSREILEEQISNLLSVREAWIAVDNAAAREAMPSPSSASRGNDLSPKAEPSDWSV